MGERVFKGAFERGLIGIRVDFLFFLSQPIGIRPDRRTKQQVELELAAEFGLVAARQPFVFLRGSEAVDGKEKAAATTVSSASAICFSLRPRRASPTMAARTAKVPNEAAPRVSQTWFR